MKEKTVIIIPCYNEEKRISEKAFIDYSDKNPNIHFLFVNDGSTDNTEFVLKKLCANSELSFSFISYKKNQGKAEAVRIGVLKALQDNPDYVGYWDADLATPLNTINSFANEFHKNKNLLFILGARTKLLGRKIIRKHYRHYLGRIFATVISCTFSLPIYDTQCGAKMFRVIPELDKIFNKKFKAKWIFDVEIILRFREIFTNSNLHLEKVAHEYPLTNWNEIYGSKITLLDYFKSMFDFLKLFISYSKKREKQ